MTDLRHLLKDASEKLVFSDSPMTDAYELANMAFGLNKTDILFEPVRNVGSEQLEKFGELIDKRATGYPLQYILGEWDFFGLTFKVDEGVLIPRPETEQIAAEACKFLKNKKNAVVFDLCAGTGCIGISVAVNNPECRVYLADISGVAIECQKKNVGLHGLDNVTVLDYDILSGFKNEILPEPDVILCNPPYVTKEEYEALDREIFFEPENAIVCGGDGLDFYRCLCEEWIKHLKIGGLFMFECGEEQPQKVIDMIDDRRYDVSCSEDIYGVCRFVIGTKT